MVCLPHRKYVIGAHPISVTDFWWYHICRLEEKKKNLPTLFSSFFCCWPNWEMGRRLQWVYILDNIENQKREYLLDTGSQVTTISHIFYQRYLSRIPLSTINNLLRVEAANGETIPYMGYIEVEIELPGAMPKMDKVTVNGLVLTVPDTAYNRRGPFCVGMNVTRSCVEKAHEVLGNNDGIEGVSVAWQMVYSILAGPKPAW